MSGRRLAAAVALAAVLAHVRSAWFAFTDLDDRDLIVDDQAFLARPANLARAFGRTYMHVVDPAHAYYRPLVTLSYGLDAQWSGARPFGYHLTNLALHAIASSLLFALLLRFALPPAVAALGAIVFAVHPALAAAVAWIPGRNDSLLAALSLAAWLFLLRDRARPSRVDRALHLGLFALALLTKETAVALPLVWLAQAVLVDRARGPAPALYLSGWALLVGLAVLVHRARLGDVGAVGIGTLGEKLPQVFAGLGRVVLPVDPTVLAAAQDQSIWAGLLAAAGIAAGARFVKGVRGRVVAFGMVAFVLLLAPVLAMPGTLVLDSRLYLPACGVLLAIGEIVRAAAFERAPHAAAAGGPDPAPARLFVGLSAIVVLVPVGITAGYEPSFRDPRAFARAAADGSPHSALAHFCLGRVYQGDGDEDRALAEYKTSLALGPGEVVHNNIAVIYMAHARWAEAEGQLREELALNPRYARAYDNLAIVLRREGRQEEALAAATKARDLDE